MKLWRRRHTPPDEPRHRRDEPSEATLARIQAERDLEATRAETPHYQALAERLRELRERNNFAAAFRQTIQGGHPR